MQGVWVDGKKFAALAFRSFDGSVGMDSRSIMTHPKEESKILLDVDSKNRQQRPSINWLTR